MMKYFILKLIQLYKMNAFDEYIQEINPKYIETSKEIKARKALLKLKHKM